MALGARGTFARCSQVALWHIIRTTLESASEAHDQHLHTRYGYLQHAAVHRAVLRVYTIKPYSEVGSCTHIVRTEHRTAVLSRYTYTVQLYSALRPSRTCYCIIHIFYTIRITIYWSSMVNVLRSGLACRVPCARRCPSDGRWRCRALSSRAAYCSRPLRPYCTAVRRSYRARVAPSPTDVQLCPYSFRPRAPGAPGRVCSGLGLGAAAISAPSIDHDLVVHTVLLP